LSPPPLSFSSSSSSTLSLHQRKLLIAEPIAIVPALRYPFTTLKEAVSSPSCLPPPPLWGFSSSFGFTLSLHQSEGFFRAFFHSFFIVVESKAL
jgi:hypothetical protein